MIMSGVSWGNVPISCCSVPFAKLEVRANDVLDDLRNALICILY